MVRIKQWSLIPKNDRSLWAEKEKMSSHLVDPHSYWEGLPVHCYPWTLALLLGNYFYDHNPLKHIPFLKIPTDCMAFLSGGWITLGIDGQKHL